MKGEKLGVFSVISGEKIYLTFSPPKSYSLRHEAYHRTGKATYSNRQPVALIAR